MKHTRRRHAVTFALLLMCGISMLIWLKLRVVTNVPRTAYADPSLKRSQVDQPAQGRPAPAQPR